MSSTSLSASPGMVFLTSVTEANPGPTQRQPSSSPPDALRRANG
jgi:hypothetical protein